MSHASVPPSHFDALHAQDADPYGVRSRWYERRKYALSLAALRAPQYDRGLEIGCSIGEMTAALAPRCRTLLAVDGAVRAVAAARRRTRDLPGVTVGRALVPHDWPPGRYELVVLSEVGYFLSSEDLARLAGRVSGSLAAGGELLAVHWRHPSPNNPGTGDAVHTRLRQEPFLEPSGRWEEEDFLVDVLVRR